MRPRLAVMMFLQYAIWGAWAPVLWPFLTGPLGFSQKMAGWVFSLLWLACMLAPITGGQIADRFLPTQWFLSGAHLLGGALLIALGLRSEVGPAAQGPWLALMGAYA